MATTSAEVVFVDTNVLLDATDRARPRHAAARRLIERPSRLVFSAQIVREYLAAATRPPDVDGLGLDVEHALENVAEFRRVIRLLPEEKPLLTALLSLMRRVPVRGKTVHDALVVATMRVHRVSDLVTANPDDFARFAGEIRVREL